MTSENTRQDQKHKTYPLLTRIEWHLSGSRYFSYAFDHTISKARVRWHDWREKRRLIPESLNNFESKVFCQNGEDGIIKEIFRRIGEGDKFAVEFGIGDGTECCTRNLFVNHGWAGLLIEGSEPYVANAKSLYKDNSKVNAVCSYIRLDNILEIFRENNVPESPDLLVVDIDGNDYWILERILTACRPRVIISEYSSRWVPPIDWVMPYNANHVWDGSAYFGASLSAFVRLARSNGYTLVCCDSRGVNAFFVRDDLVGNHFPDHHLGSGLYVPPHYGRGYGHQLRFRS
jgi:hypothetical protein